MYRTIYVVFVCTSIWTLASDNTSFNARAVYALSYAEKCQHECYDRTIEPNLRRWSLLLRKYDTCAANDMVRHISHLSYTYERMSHCYDDVRQGIGRLQEAMERALHVVWLRNTHAQLITLYLWRFLHHEQHALQCGRDPLLFQTAPTAYRPLYDATRQYISSKDMHMAYVQNLDSLRELHCIFGIPVAVSYKKKHLEALLSCIQHQYNYITISDIPSRSQVLETYQHYFADIYNKITEMQRILYLESYRIRCQQMPHLFKDTYTFYTYWQEKNEQDPISIPFSSGVERG